MSQGEIDNLDAEFAELLGEEGNEGTNMPETDIEAPTQGAADPPKAIASVDAAATQEHQMQLAADEDKGAACCADKEENMRLISGAAAAVSGGASKKPALAGRKRQLTVPSGTPASAPASTTRPSLKAKAAINPKTTAAPLLTVAPNAPDPTPTASTNTAAASAVSPLKRHKTSAAPATKSEATAAVTEGDATADETAEAEEDEAMQEAGEEEEVRSPVKTADRPTPAAPPAPAATSHKAKPAAARKKGLQVSKASGPADSAATNTSIAAGNKAPKPPKAKRTKLATAAGPSSSTTTAAPAVKLPKPKNAFMIFSDEERASIKEANPDFGIGDIAKQLGVRWKAMTADEKQPYTNKAVADKERCAAEIAAMDPELVAAIRKAEVDKRAVAKESKKGAAAAAIEGGVAAPARSDKSAAKAAGKEPIEAEKSEQAAEKTEAAAARKAEKAAAKAAAREEASKRTAAFKCFHTSSYKCFKEKNPAAAPEEINTEIKNAWDALDEQEQAPFFTRAEEEAEALKAASKAKAKTTSSECSGSKQAGRLRKSGAGSDAAAGDDSDGHDGDEKTAAPADDDDSDREEVDWEEYPAAAIIAHTTDGASLLVQRQGIGLNEYGAVNARKAKQQLMGPGVADDSEKLPVTAAMLEEYEQFKKSFWSAVHRRTCKGSIDMEDLEEGSPLEICYLLGKLQEENHLCCPKGKAARNKGTKEEDFLITVPGLKLSMAMQRVVNVVRKDKLLLQQHMSQLLQALEAESSFSSKTQEAMSVAKAALLQHAAAH